MTGNNQYPVVSFIIPVKTETVQLQQCIDSIIRQEYPLGRIEIITVGPELNQPSARNNAIKRSTGEFIFNFNAHAVAKPDLVRVVLSKFNSTVDAVGYRVDSFPETTISKLLESPFAGAGTGVYTQNVQGTEDRAVRHVPFVCYRRSVFEKVGFFDESFNSGCDSELNHRLFKAGMTLLYTADTGASLNKPSTLNGLFRKMYNYGYARGRIIRKHPDSQLLLHLVPEVCFFSLLVLCVLSLFSVFFLGLLAGVMLLYMGVSLFCSYIASDRWDGLVVFPLVHLGYTFGIIHGRWSRE